MKNKFKAILLIFVTLFTFLLASCGTSSVNGDSYDKGVASGENNNVVIETTRKIYYTVDYDINAKDYTKIKKELSDKVNSLDGYIQKSTDSETYSNYVYRIPTLKLNEFLDYVDAYGDTVESKKVTSTDITTTYSEKEAKKEVLSASRKAYLSLLNDGTLSMSDIIAIQDKISNLDIEISIIEKELASYDNLLDYSTVTIDYRTDNDLSFIAQYGNYLGGFFVGLGQGILYLLPVLFCGAIICLAAFVIIKVSKKNKKNK